MTLALTNHGMALPYHLWSLVKYIFWLKSWSKYVTYEDIHTYVNWLGPDKFLKVINLALLPTPFEQGQNRLELALEKVSLEVSNEYLKEPRIKQPINCFHFTVCPLLGELTCQVVQKKTSSKKVIIKKVFFVLNLFFVEDNVESKEYPAESLSK